MILKITFMGAGSTVFVRNVIGDCMCTPSLSSAEVALYDIDEKRLNESLVILEAMKKTKGVKMSIKTYAGEGKRREALRGADFVVNAVQVGGYKPCTVIDFEIPKKYGLRQTIGDTLGIGGIMRALRTIPVMEAFARDMEEVCPNALFLNYTNPMSMLTGFMLRYTGVKTVGLCHSVQVCPEALLSALDMKDKLEGAKSLIAGINHMGWLLEICDKDGRDLYPEVKSRVDAYIAHPDKLDKVRMDYIRNFGYYCTESSEHNAEYNPFYIKRNYPELVEKFNIPLDEYPRRCITQAEAWEKEYREMLEKGVREHNRSHEYASYIMQSVVENIPYEIGGNVLNTDHLISNFPEEACVEVPCLVNGRGINPCHVGSLPVQLAAMNMTHINVHLLTIEAAVTKKREHIYQAAMLDPHTASELDIDSIKKMVDELIVAHGDYLPRFN